MKIPAGLSLKDSTGKKQIVAGANSMHTDIVEQAHPFFPRGQMPTVRAYPLHAGRQRAEDIVSAILPAGDRFPRIQPAKRVAIGTVAIVAETTSGIVVQVLRHPCLEINLYCLVDLAIPFVEELAILTRRKHALVQELRRDALIR